MDDKRIDGHKFVNISQMAEIFGVSAATIKKRIYKASPSHQVGRVQYYRFNDVCSLNDDRKSLPTEEEYDPIYSRPDDLNPADRRAYYQAEDLKQSSLLKRRKNQMEEYQLIQVHLVERGITLAFKAVVTSLNTLPDVLERDGIIDNLQISHVIELVDGMRATIAGDLSTLIGKGVDSE